MTRIEDISKPHHERGVTLVEMIVVMVVIGILAAAGGVGISQAMDNYRAAQERAEVMEMADTALRRMARDIRLALPNSVRKDASGQYLELLITKNGGRYVPGSATSALNVGTSGVGGALDAEFDPVGGLPDGVQQTVAANDIVVVNNLTADAGTTAGNAYTREETHCTAEDSVDCNTTKVSSWNSTTLTFVGNRRFTSGSPIDAFYVLPEKPAVTYVCTPGVDADGNGTGTLKRRFNYTMRLNQPDAPGDFSIGTPEAIVAEHVVSCTFSAGTVANVIYMELNLKRRGQSVTLFHQVWLPNG